MESLGPISGSKKYGGNGQHMEGHGQSLTLTIGGLKRERYNLSERDLSPNKGRGKGRERRRENRGAEERSLVILH